MINTQLLLSFPVPFVFWKWKQRTFWNLSQTFTKLILKKMFEIPGAGGYFFFFFFLNYTTSGSNCLIKGHRAWRVTHFLKLERPCQQTCTLRVVSSSSNSTLKEKWQKQKGQGRELEGKDLQDPSCPPTHVPSFVQIRAHGKMSIPSQEWEAHPRQGSRTTGLPMTWMPPSRPADDRAHREIIK